MWIKFNAYPWRAAWISNAFCVWNTHQLMKHARVVVTAKFRLLLVIQCSVSKIVHVACSNYFLTSNSKRRNGNSLLSKWMWEILWLTEHLCVHTRRYAYEPAQTLGLDLQWERSVQKGGTWPCMKDVEFVETLSSSAYFPCDLAFFTALIAQLLKIQNYSH